MMKIQRIAKRGLSKDHPTGAGIGFAGNVGAVPRTHLPNQPTAKDGECRGADEKRQ